MSFRFGRFFYLTISWIVGAFFFLIGLFGIILPWSDYLQRAATELVLHHTLMLSLFGLGFTLIGLSVVTYAILNAGKRYAFVRTGNRAVVLDEALIEQYLEKYWKETFPHHQIPFYITIRKRSIQIVADLPATPEADQDRFLSKIQEDFADIFGRMLGYPNEVHFIAHFQNN